MNYLFWFFGFLGNIILSLCGIPLLYDTLKNGQTTSNKFLLAWFLGELFAILYAIHSHLSFFIILNYSISILLITSIYLIQKFKKRN